jgi:predicted AAA+ superfamily ATPase
MQYWKGSRNQEVDIVLQLDGIGIPLEVKSSDEPSYNDLSGLKAFCKKYNVPGIVVCGKKLDLKENIIFVPHWLFTLIC